MYTLLAFVSIFGIIVFLHELGHFLAARSVGVRVDKFYVGFDFFGLGYKVYENNGTEYGIGLFPFGGYCKIAGMVDESLDDTVTGGDDEFNSKNTMQKLWILSAGVIMNFLLAILLFFFVFIFYGESTLAPVAYNIIDDKPAFNAGMEPGSIITAINGNEIFEWSDIAKNLSSIGEQGMVTINYIFNNQYKKIRLEPETIQDENGKRRIIGIERVPDDIIQLHVDKYIIFRKIGFLKALERSLIAPLSIISLQIGGLSQLISGNIGLDNLGGPIKITQMAGEAAKFGAAYFLQFMAMISTILGFMNILPIPGLDGGHGLITIIEGLSQREIPLKIKMGIQQFAVLLILGLTFFILINDIKNL